MGRPSRPTRRPKLFVDGKIDAYLGFPPRPQELRARKIGRVIVNSASTGPGRSISAACVTGSREFVRSIRSRPSARCGRSSRAPTCAPPSPSAWRACWCDRKYTARYDYLVQVLKELPYGKWREYDPEDTIRFYALRLHEAGMVKSSPQKLIAQASDWRILTELKKELRG